MTTARSPPRAYAPGTHHLLEVTEMSPAQRQDLRHMVPLLPIMGQASDDASQLVPVTQTAVPRALVTSFLTRARFSTLPRAQAVWNLHNVPASVAWAMIDWANEICKSGVVAPYSLEKLAGGKDVMQHLTAARTLGVRDDLFQLYHSLQTMYPIAFQELWNIATASRDQNLLDLMHRAFPNWLTTLHLNSLL